MGGLLAGWLDVIISIVLPFAFLVYLVAKRRGQVTSFVVGIAAFCVAEVLVVVPLFQMLAALPFMAANPVVYILLLALCAAVMGGFTRWLAFTYILRSKRSFMDGVALGVGYSTITIALPAVGYLISALFFPAVLQSVSFASIASDCVESILTLAMQVAVTLLILRGVRDTKPLFIVFGVGTHLLFRAVAALRYVGFGDWGQRAVLAVIACATLFYVLKNRMAFGFGEGKPAQKKAAIGPSDPGSLDENIWK